MKQLFIRSVVRTRFLLTRRPRASTQIRRTSDGYLEAAQAIGAVDGRRPVRVPPMLGVDEDMRDWSFYMLLEHNTIVNRIITVIVRSLASGESLGDVAKVDLKQDVMPSADPGPEQVDAFRRSVDEHLEIVSSLPRLRGTETKRHPVFGPLTSHGWHCMYGLHLEIHLRQAHAVIRALHHEKGEQR